MMVLRICMLTIFEENSDREVQLWRETFDQLNVNQNLQPLNAKFMFEGLPVTKARNSYIRLVDGRIRVPDGRRGVPSLTSQICFRFFPIAAEHFNLISSILLVDLITS